LLTDKRTISSRDILTLKTLRKKNIVTAVATGRSDYSFFKALKAVGMAEGSNLLPVDYVMLSTGAGLMDFSEQKMIFQKQISPKDVRIIVDYFDHMKIDYMVHKKIPHTRQFLYKSHGYDNPDFKARLALYKDYATPLLNGYRDFEPATEVLAVIPGGADAGSMKSLRKDLAGFSVIQATSPLDHQSVWIEVFHKTVSKAKTASWLARRLGVKPRNIISIGNDYNDEDLLAWSGTGYVVENAPDYLKNQFETVDSNNKDGVTMAAKKSGWID